MKAFECDIDPEIFNYRYFNAIAGGPSPGEESLRKEAGVWLLTNVSKAKEAGAEVATLRKAEKELEDLAAQLAERQKALDSLRAKAPKQ